MIYRTQFYTLSLDYGAKHDDTFVYSGWKRLAPYMQYFKSHYCLGIPAGFIGYNVKSRTIILTPPCIYLSSCLSSLYTFIPPVYPPCIYLYLLFILLVYIYTSCLSSLYISIPTVYPPCIYLYLLFILLVYIYMYTFCSFSLYISVLLFILPIYICPPVFPPCIYLYLLFILPVYICPPVYPPCIYLYLLFILLVYIYTFCSSSLYIYVILFILLVLNRHTFLLRLRSPFSSFY